MNRKELIKSYLEFFKKKNHKVIPNASLIPKDDSSVLFTTAGMHPLVPFLLGQKHPQGKRLVNVQKCIRTGDIEEVGDSFHHTFFEMLGNWSLGDYFKEDAIKFSFEFLTKILKIPLENLAVTCFAGNKISPKDITSKNIWKSLDIPLGRIAFIEKDNWWGPAGKTGPCGPTTEMFVWKLKNIPAPKKFNPNDENWIEIWNDVFMQYNKDEKEIYQPLKQKNVDTGMGVERTLAILNNLEDNYLTEVWQPIIKKIEELSGLRYISNNNVKGNKTNLRAGRDSMQKLGGHQNQIQKAMRIIADHIKTSVFILAEGITPSNTEHGYVLRRLIRRAVRYGKNLKLKDFATKLIEPIIKIYSDYPELNKNKKFILDELKKEEEKFEKTLEKGLNKFKRFTSKNKLSGKDAFLLFQSFGFPIEMIEEECKKNKIKFSKKEFESEYQKHQKLSRTASQGRFKSGLADSSEKTTKLHTSAHLLLTALKKVLKDESIIQKGSNITPERLRMDFSFPRKLTEKEIKDLEDLVNKEIQKSQEVKKQEMTLEEAKKQGAEGIFEAKYKDKVSVYSVGNFSKEICAGPHVKNTKELGKFKIAKETSSSSGVRRIKAVLE